MTTQTLAFHEETLTLAILLVSTVLFTLIYALFRKSHLFNELVTISLSYCSTFLCTIGVGLMLILPQTIDEVAGQVRTTSSGVWVFPYSNLLSWLAVLVICLLIFKIATTHDFFSQFSDDTASPHLSKQESEDPAGSLKKCHSGSVCSSCKATCQNHDHCNCE